MGYTSHKTNAVRQLAQRAEPRPDVRTPPPPAAGAVDSVLELSHARIAVRQTAGPGVPLLFLHGNSSCKDVFDGQLMSPLGLRHRCVAIDLPGHGASSDAYEPSTTYSIEGFADLAAEVLETFDIGQVVVVGWSLGGHVALELLASFPGVVGAMIIGAPPVRSGLRGILSGFRMTSRSALLARADLTRDQAEQLGYASVGSRMGAALTPMIERTDGRARKLVFASMLRGTHADQRETVEWAQAPLAIVNGADDPFINARSFSRPNYANLWRGTCHRIPGGGHAPFLNAAPLFNNLLAHFAQDMDARAHDLRDAPQLVYSG